MPDVVNGAERAKGSDRRRPSGLAPSRPRSEIAQGGGEPGRRRVRGDADGDGDTRGSGRRRGPPAPWARGGGAREVQAGRPIGQRRCAWRGREQRGCWITLGRTRDRE